MNNLGCPFALTLTAFLLLAPLSSAQTYLAATPPGQTPEVFAPGVVSQKATIDFAPAFAPAGDEFYFSRLDIKARTSRILVASKEKGVWSKPAPVAFTSAHMDAEAFVAPDGKRLFFVSSRPLPGQQAIQQGNIWTVEKRKKGWSDPKPLGPGINTPDREGHPTLSSNGVLYFHRIKKESYDIYRSAPVDGQYLTAEKLGPAINTTEHIEGEPYISPKEDYLIFISAGREDRVANKPGICDLYISFRDSQYQWTTARPMGKTILSEAEENWPRVTPDGRYLFFSSNRDRTPPFPDIYWVDAKVIHKLRQLVLK